MVVKPLRQTSVRMQKKQERSLSHLSPTIHLAGTTGRRMEHPDTPGLSHLCGLIGTSAVNHDALDTGTTLGAA